MDGIPKPAGSPLKRIAQALVPNGRRHMDGGNPLREIGLCVPSSPSYRWPADPAHAGSAVLRGAKPRAAGMASRPSPWETSADGEGTMEARVRRGAQRLDATHRISCHRKGGAGRSDTSRPCS